MWEFIVFFTKCVAVIAAAALLVVVFYMPRELRQDLRSPEISKEYKWEMRSEQRWQNAIVGWRILCVLLLAAVAILIIHLLMSIPA